MSFVIGFSLRYCTILVKFGSVNEMCHPSVAAVNSNNPYDA